MRLSRVQTIKPGSGVKVVFAGNSLVAGDGSTSTPLPTAFSNLAGSTVVSNQGQSGYTWQDITNNATATDAAYDSSKTNVLFVWETTNSVFNQGRTQQQTIDDALAYIAARKAAHPAWKIVMITTIPRETGTFVTDQTSRTAKNQTNEAVDAYFLANMRASGLDAVVNVRRYGSQFILPDYTSASFAVSTGYWAESAGSRVHLNDTGYQAIAALCFETFKRLPAR